MKKILLVRKSKIIYFLLVLIFILPTSLYSDTKNVTQKELKRLEKKFLNNSDNTNIKNSYRNKLYSFLKKHYEENELKPTLKFCKKATYYFPENKKLRNIVSSIYFKCSQIEKKEIKSTSEVKNISLKDIRKKNKVTRLLNKAFQKYKEKKLKESKNLLREALSINKNKNFALYLLGKILIEENKLKEGLKYWKKIPNEKTLNVDINKQIEQVKKELKLQKGFIKVSWKNFNFYTPRDYTNISYSLRSNVSKIFREVGTDFNYYPKYQIPIILYPKERFEKISDKFYPTAGLYDGKIRLPLNDKENLYQVLRHEYTHLIMKDLTHGNLPIWLNEGIAEYEAEVSNWRKEKLKEYCQKNDIIPITQLNNIFTKRNQGKLLIAYTEVYAFIDYIIYRYNMHTLLQIIKDFKNNKSENEIFKERTAKSIEGLASSVEKFIKTIY